MSLLHSLLTSDVILFTLNHELVACVKEYTQFSPVHGSLPPSDGEGGVQCDSGLKGPLGPTVLRLIGHMESSEWGGERRRGSVKAVTVMCTAFVCITIVTVEKA